MVQSRLANIFSYLRNQLQQPNYSQPEGLTITAGLDLINLQRVRMFSFLLALTNILSAVADYFFLSPDGPGGIAGLHTAPVHLGFSVSYCTLGMLARVKSRPSEKQLHRLSVILTWIFTFISILFGLYVGVYEHLFTSNASIYLMIICALLIIFYRNKNESLALMLSGNLIYAAMIFFYERDPLIYSSQGVNLALFSIIFFLISRSFYRNKVQEFQTSQQLENQENLLQVKNHRLQEAEITLSSINRNILQGLFRMNGEGKLVYANEFLFRLFNYASPEEMTADWNQGKIIPEAKIREIQTIIGKEGIVKDFEIRQKRKDGTDFWALVNCSQSKVGDNIFYDGSLIDNTERKNNEKMLENLSLVASKTDNCVFIIGRNEKIEWVNEGFTRTTGYAFEEAVGKKPGILFQGENTNPDTIRELGEKISRGEGFTGELLNYRKDGSEFWVHFTLNPILNRKNEIIKYVVVESDITERKKVEQELIKAKEQAEMSMKAKDDFLSMVSHELRTPLNAVIGMTHLLLQENPREDQTSNLKTLKTSGEYLLSLINDILDFSKIEAGKIYIDHAVFNFYELIQALEQTFYYQAQEKNIKFYVDVDPRISEYLVGDPTRINQILVNLIGNSIKFTDAGFVKLSVTLLESRKEDQCLQFKVTDTGIGIPEEKLSTIFERFEQVRNRSKRGGTGLGLAITKSLVELMGGSITVESELGDGSEFTFNLQILSGSADQLKAELNDSDNKSYDLSQLRILLVEDNKINQLVAAKFLNQWNVQYDMAEDGFQSINMAKQYDYNLILMDLQMPDMDGLTAAKAIRKIKKYRQTPIIALTAASLEAKEEVYKAGMNDFLIKPFNPLELYNKIKKYGKTQKSSQKWPRKAQTSELDISGIQKISDGDSHFLLELLNLCVEQFKSLPNQLTEAIKDQDLTEARNLIHKINPSIKMLQYHQLEKTTLEFHKLLRSNHCHEDIEQKANELIGIINKIENQLLKKAKDLNGKLPLE